MNILKRVQKKKKEEKTNVVSQQQTSFGEYGVLKRPHLSEKAYDIQKNGQYVFWVKSSATKSMIKHDVQKRYNVRVNSVRTVVLKSKARFFRGNVSQKNSMKKAVVTLGKGEKIEIV